MTGPLSGPDDTSTDSLRAERGEPAAPDPRETQSAVPLGPSSIGVVGHGPAPLPAENDLEREQPEIGDESESR